MDVMAIKTTIEELLQRMNVQFEAVEVVQEPLARCPKFTIKTTDSAVLIGSKGANLFALTHLVKKITARKQNTEETRFIVDVNDYQEKWLAGLKAKAMVMSGRARSFKINIELEPMSAYERLIIHLYLEGTADIKTESTGEGKNRRVVIKYVPQEEP